MQNTSDRQRVRKHSSHLSHASVMIDRIKFPCIKESVPIGHVNDKVIVLRPWVGELGEKAPRTKVVVILVDLSDGVTDFQVRLEIIHPVFLRTVDGNATVGALKVRVGRRQCAFGALPRFRIVGRERYAGLLMTRMRTKSILFDECRTLSNRGCRGFRERVKEVVWFQQSSCLLCLARRGGRGSVR